MNGKTGYIMQCMIQNIHQITTEYRKGIQTESKNTKELNL